MKKKSFFLFFVFLPVLIGQLSYAQNVSDTIEPFRPNFTYTSDTKKSKSAEFNSLMTRAAIVDTKIFLFNMKVEGRGPYSLQADAASVAFIGAGLTLVFSGFATVSPYILPGDPRMTKAEFEEVFARWCKGMKFVAIATTVVGGITGYVLTVNDDHRIAKQKYQDKLSRMSLDELIAEKEALNAERNFLEGKLHEYGIQTYVQK